MIKQDKNQLFEFFLYNWLNLVIIKLNWIKNIERK